MLIEKTSEYYLKRTRAFAKEIEFNIPESLRAIKDVDIDDLFPLVIACIADLSAEIVRGNMTDEQIKDHAKELYFASKFFDSYLQISCTTPHANPNYFNLVGAIAYYLCDQIGSSLVLAKRLDSSALNLSTQGLDVLLCHLLRNDPEIPDSSNTNPSNSALVSDFIHQYNDLMSCGITVDQDFINRFRYHFYDENSYRDIFLVDALLAVFILKIKHSIFEMLPHASYIPLTTLIDIVKSNHFVREMWPAQRYMCSMGLFMGASGVIQMPTGAGKTKSVSMAIYSAFCSGRVNLSVVIAPFRALCREITNDLRSDLAFDDNIQISEISDLLQVDYLLEELFNPNLKTVVVTTPEKFLYIVRQEENILDGIGQIIFDEGHLFDDEERGPAYELLISSILKGINPQAQRILISAIIPNVKEINDWFTKGTGIAFSGNDISGVEKLPAALRWENHGGNNYCYLYYISKEGYKSHDFFVPRVIDVTPLQQRRGERQRHFPSVDFARRQMLETNDMAIACLLKIVPNDNVAIFCGRKDSANKILSRIIELQDRGYDVSGLRKRANLTESTKLANLLCKNYGSNSLLYRAAQLGVFAHHAGVSDGIKNAVEYALKEAMITNVVCTSTLAQGVNLPIKYLVVSSIYQAGEQIKVRDFHNLIGRTARSGMFTEGTIIFSDPFAYQVDRWRWDQYRRLLDFSNSESCSSVILDVVRSHTLRDKSSCCFYKVALMRYEDFERFQTSKAKFLTNNPPSSELGTIFTHVFHVLSRLEGYIALSLANNNNGMSENLVEDLLGDTLADALASEEEREQLKNLFTKICEYITTTIPDEHSKRNFARSMISCEAYLELHKEISTSDIDQMNDEELLSYIVTIISKYSSSRIIKRMVNTNDIAEIAKMWMHGDAYNVIHSIADLFDYKVIRRKREETISLEEIITMCDNDFGYSSSIIINSVCEILNSLSNDEVDYGTTIESLYEISQKLKYGLSEHTDIFIYELGFNDRCLAQEIRGIIGSQNKKKDTRKAIIHQYQRIAALLESYPAVYLSRLDSL